jgi:hypothetical protein
LNYREASPLLLHEEVRAKDATGTMDGNNNDFSKIGCEENDVKEPEVFYEAEIQRFRDSEKQL